MNADERRSTPGIPETESIDRLFLELSQFTKATTGKELKLIEAIGEARSKAMKLGQKIETLGCSYELTEASVMASDLVQLLNNALPH